MVSLQELTEINHLPEAPLDIFHEWFEHAKALDLPQYNAMTLATVSGDGQPNARIVLLKHYDAQGFVFFTNYESQKAKELMDVHRACLVFYWPELGRQVRIRGAVEKVSAEDSQAYFSTRPRESQWGAIASKQGRPLDSRGHLEARFQQAKQTYQQVEKIPCPSYWGGYLLKAHEIEFWVNGQNRLHDRFLYRRQDSSHWNKQRLYP